MKKKRKKIQRGIGRVNANRETRNLTNCKRERDREKEKSKKELIGKRRKASRYVYIPEQEE